MIYGNATIHGEPALRALYEEYLSYCHEAWDPKEIYLGPQEWAEEITMGVLKIVTAEPYSEYAEDTKFQVGDKVRRADGITGLATENGVVLINSAWLVKVEDFSGLQLPIDLESMNHHGQLVRVAWYAPDGNVICIGWHNPDSLELKS